MGGWGGITHHVHLKQRLPLSSETSSEPSSEPRLVVFKDREEASVCSSAGDKRQENLFIDTSERSEGVN